MRFLEDSPDIPDDLIRAVTDGDAVFLCGAGVSKKAGLPLFGELARTVYRELGESETSEPAERKAFEREEYDRALRSLEKRTHRPGSKSRVRTVVADVLKAKAGMDLANHSALIKLSRDASGNPRLLTTNFDTLFERAVAGAGIPVVSHAGKSMPKSGGDRDYGILHLHGRIDDPDVGLEESELVLTSADFGDAYLRDGWASQYVEDRMRVSKLVLVGYAAEDAALRLLLETLDADRVRFKDLNDVYALDMLTDDTASIWKAKGIIPIEFEEYPGIYASLAEWANYASRPSDYARARVQQILLPQPKESGL